MSQRFGRYVGERVLGSGTFATVWLARDETLDSYVAVKVLAENWARDPAVRERFVNEARVLRAADSEYVMRILTIDELGNGQPYLVMEYADRGSLADRIEQRRTSGQPFTVDEVVALAHNVAAGIGVIHRLGVIHRDIKPGNIMFRSVPAHRRVDRDEQVVLADLGVAKSFQGGGTTIATGTPYYMAPEQASGHVGFQSDLFSLTVILYELLAGQVPFPYESVGQIIAAQLRGSFTPLDQVRADVPAPLAAFVARNLDSDPARRSPSIDEWVRELYAARAGAVVPQPAAAPVAATDPGLTLGPEEFLAATGGAGTRPPVPVAPYPAPGPEPRRRRRRGLILLGTGLVAALAATVAGVVLFTGDDEADGAGREVFLEPVSSLGTDPFSDDIVRASSAVDDLTELTEEAREAARGLLASLEVPPGELPAIDLPDFDLAALATAGGDDDDDPGGVVNLAGLTPGLYGGTNLLSVCDKDLLASFLSANADKAAAWAAVLGIDVDEIGPYIDSLTDVILQVDTRVTNHGFTNGVANAIDSVLQAGTAVLVDRFGVPVVRCKCGNPLLPPRPLDADVTIIGDPWPGFDLDVTVVISATDPVVDFSLDDLLSDDVITRPPGTKPVPPAPTPTPTPEVTAVAPTPTAQATAPPSSDDLDPGIELQSGDVQVTLLWEGLADLDLHVTDPTGAEISFSSPTVASGGQLDRDDGLACPGAGVKAENVFWPEAGAPPGDYAAWVVGYDLCGGPDQSFALEIRVGGTLVDQVTATVGAGGESARIPFSVAGAAATTEPAPDLGEIVTAGTLAASSVFDGFPVELAADSNTATSWFSQGSQVDGEASTLQWTLGEARFVADVTIVGNADNATPEFRTGFGFDTLEVVAVLAGSGEQVLVGTASLSGTPDPTVTVDVGQKVSGLILRFFGHEAPDCGGISELRITGELQ